MAQLHRSIAAAAFAAAAILSAVAAHADAAGYAPPTFSNQVKPVYPDSARAAGETGTVLVKVLVQANGKATSFTVFKSSGHKDLDDAVLAAVKASTYNPAMSQGKPTLAYLDVTYRFTLQGLAEEEGNTSGFEAKLAANPNDAAARKSLAITLINKHDYEKAEDVLVKGTQLDPKNQSFWSLLGFAYYSDGVQNKKDERKREQLEKRIPFLKARINEMIGSMPEAVTQTDGWQSVAKLKPEIAGEREAAVQWLKKTEVELQSNKDLMIALANSITTLIDLEIKKDELAKQLK